MFARVCQHPSARRFHSAAAGNKTPRVSPLVHIPRPSRNPSPPIIPKSLFPDTVAWRVKHGWAYKHFGTPRFVLLHTDEPRHPAITVLPPAPSMLSYVQIVSAPTADTPGACLLLHFDNRRYLFGRMAEGIQRTMVQRKISLSKIHDIFLSGCVDWDATGGLLGMILTLADMKAASGADVKQANTKLRDQGKKEIKQVVAHLNVHGGKNLMHMLATSRRFILRKAMPVHPRELRHDPRLGDEKSEPDYKDENIQVWSIPVSSEPSSRASSSERSLKRKRSSSSDVEDAAPQDSAALEEADQKIREGIVKDMFGSKWNLDTLRELNIKDVEMPAKLFVRNAQGHIEPYTGPPPNSPDCPDINVLVRLPWPAAKIESLPATQPSRQTMCYIVKGHPRRGKFDVAAATRLGVVKTDFKKLTAGQSVPGKDGMVTPEMVIGAAIDGRGFAIVDIPFPDLVDEVLNRREWSNPEIMRGIDAMYWILSREITLDGARIQQFMKAHPSIKHILLGGSVCPNVLALESPAAQLIKMNRVDAERFPLPIFDINPPSILDKGLESVAEVGRPGLRLLLAPKTGFSTDTIVPAMDTTAPILELASRAPEVLELAAAARTSISDPAFLAEVEKAQQDLPCPDAEIVPLGTGSAMPSKYRNVSATLIRVPGWGSYILDCGENTLGQLRRSFGDTGADDILRDLRAVYISHAHADHHLGTISIIAHWRSLPDLPADRKLAIIATPKYQEFVREFQSVQPLSPSRLVPVTIRGAAGRPLPGTLGRVTFPDGIPPSSLHLPKIEACYVDHCHEATAVVLTFPDTGLKIAYSGDCRPSTTFANLARGAHLLVHECTFEDELGGDAVAKKHSTLSEALEVGRKMGARRILLTHFSQRYPKLPVVGQGGVLKGDDNGKGDGEKEENGEDSKEEEKRDVEVLFAFDMMRVKLGEFRQAAKFLPALRRLLEEGEKAGEGEEEEE
ncbi:hypothetical protein VTI74DRAFT_2897 [Chaetomium olivicolor]